MSSEWHDRDLKLMKHGYLHGLLKASAIIVNKTNY